MFNFDGDGYGGGNGDVTCKQALRPHPVSVAIYRSPGSTVLLKNRRMHITKARLHRPKVKGEIDFFLVSYRMRLSLKPKAGTFNPRLMFALILHFAVLVT